MAVLKIQIGYNRVTKADIRNVLYFICVIWLFSSKEIGSQAFGLLMTMAYPILLLNDRSKKKLGVDSEKDFPTFRKWEAMIRSKLSKIKNKLLNSKIERKKY